MIPELDRQDRARATGRPHGAGFWLGCTLAVLTLLAMYGGSLGAHMAKSSDPGKFNDDARIWLYPLDRYHDASLFPDDYLGGFAKACTGIGYRAIYRVLAPVWSATAASKVLAYLLLAIAFASLALGAAYWGGGTGAWIALALCLSTDFFLRKTMGALPRGFGFPIVALGALALIRGRMGWLAVLTCAGAAIYPPAAVPCGAALALVLLLLPAGQRGSAHDWSLRRRLVVLAATVTISGAVILPTALEVKAYGRYILPTEAETWPEAGPDGRFYIGDDRPGYGGFWQGVVSQAPRALMGAGRPWLRAMGDVEVGRRPWGRRGWASALIALLAAAGLLRLAARDPAARRLGLLFVGAGLCHVVARLAEPYFYVPQRFVAYPVPVLTILAVAASCCTLPLGRLANRFPRLPRSAAIAVAIVCLLLVGGRGNSGAGLAVAVRPEEAVYPFLASLPKNALIAGWPEGVMDNVPYVAHRQAFLTRQLHLPFNLDFTEELRRRMRAVIDAYLGTDPAAVSRLRDEFGVTHLIVDRRDFIKGPPEYFAPFDEWQRDAFVKGRREGFALPALIDRAAVFQSGPLAVMDLTRLAPAPPAGSVR